MSTTTSWNFSVFILGDKIIFDEAIKDTIEALYFSSPALLNSYSTLSRQFYVFGIDVLIASVMRRCITALENVLNMFRDLITTTSLISQILILMSS